MRVTRSVFAIVVAMTLCFTTAVARASDDGGTNTGSPTPGAGEPGGEPVAVVALGADGGVIASVHHAGPGRSGHWTCHYWAGGGTVEGSTATGPAIVTPVPMQAVELKCLDDSGATVYDKTFLFDPADPLGGLDDPAQAAANALAALHLPAPALATNPPGAQLVGLATWLWTTDATTLQASATLGGVTSTVTATPTRTVWTTSPDDLSVTCTGPGTPYDPTKPPDSQSTDCSLVFETAGPHQVTATTTYAITWMATTGDGGPLDPLTRTATITVAVDQAQALIN